MAEAPPPPPDTDWPDIGDGPGATPATLPAAPAGPGKLDAIPTRQFTSIDVLNRTMVDVAVATAKSYRRSPSTFKALAASMVGEDVEVAKSCYYALPRGGKDIFGPSVRLAEIVAYCWGNLRAGAEPAEEAEKYITALGYAHDLEANLARTIVVRRGILNQAGTRFKDDMVTVTMNAACAIAYRNAVLGVIPRHYYWQLYELARKVARGDAKTLVSRRDACVEYFQKEGVEPQTIATRVGVKRVGDIGLDELEVLVGIASAVRDGALTIVQAFPTMREPAEPVADALRKQLDKS